jgi:hypothetical protein
VSEEARRVPVGAYSAEQLNRCIALADELMAVGDLLPRELWLKAETWRLDMLVYQQDRARGVARRGGVGCDR